jgi:N-acetylmuramoyl-L-alanine amidase
MKYTRYLLVFTLLILTLSLAGAAAAQSEDTYVVQPGDTLQSIAVKYNSSVEAIAARNGIINPNDIRRGQVLIIPRAGANVNAVVRTYIVQPGDNLQYIATRYGVTVEELVSVNNITTSTLLRAGQELHLPTSGGIVAPATTVSRQMTTTTTTATTTTTPIRRIAVNGVYRVQPGDTMLEIARSFNVDVFNLARANGIFNLNRIYVGQHLHIPGH